jgi:hypothetical protein
MKTGKTKTGKTKTGKTKTGKTKTGKTKKDKWVARVKTDSTHPPAGLFTKSATTIAKALASKNVSPKGPGSGLRMLTYFINRSGRGLSAKRGAELEKAKSLLSKKITERSKPQAERARRKAREKSKIP